MQTKEEETSWQHKQDTNNKKLTLPSKQLFLHQTLLQKGFTIATGWDATSYKIQKQKTVCTWTTVSVVINKIIFYCNKDTSFDMASPF